MQIIAVIIVFALCMVGLSIGVLLSQQGLRGTCGSDPIENKKGESLSCGVCPKKEAEICPSDDPMIALAQMSNPNKNLHR